MEIPEILQLIQQYGLGNVLLGGGLLFGSKYIVSGVKCAATKLHKYFTSIKELEKKMDIILDDINDLKTLSIKDAVTEALKQHELDIQRQHDLQMFKRTELISEGNTLAEELLHTISADWVGLYEYCNGSSNLAGIPFLNFLALIAKGDNVKGIEAERRNISRLGTLLVDLYKTPKPFIVVDAKSTVYKQAAYYIKELGYINGIFVPLPGKSNLGFILILFKGEIPRGTILKRTLTVYSLKLSSLFGDKGIF